MIERVFIMKRTRVERAHCAYNRKRRPNKYGNSWRGHFQASLDKSVL